MERRIAELRKREREHIKTRLRSPQDEEEEYEILYVEVEPGDRVVEHEIESALEKIGWRFAGKDRSGFLGSTVMDFHKGEEE